MPFNRRTFIRNATLSATGIAAGKLLTAATPTPTPTDAPSKINIGFIGVGMRGQDHVSLILDRDDCEAIAICDIEPRMIESTKKIFTDKGKRMPAVYDKGERDYLRLLEHKGLDAVIISTPWQWHTEMSIAAMKAKKYVGVEVCGAFSLDECWQLVNTHETTGMHLMFLENVCYRRDVMAVLNMVRQNMFGELVHLECGYQHDLRAVKFNDGANPYGGGVEFGEKGFSEARWRTIQSVHRNGDLYPTHGIGPVSQFININRGNRILYLTATASKARGLHDYIVQQPKGGNQHPNASVEFKLGDLVSTVLKCNNGETVIISHDTSLPRPYSLGFRVQGTKGIWMDLNKSLHIEGVSKPHQWEKADDFLKRYDHPLWQKYEHQAEGAGHGGMDFFVLHAFVECVKRNLAPPIDVYDAATWMAITPLSEASIATGSMPQAFPDFTRGRWTTNTNTFALGNDY
ncbi:MAG: Gfo/Idh/MocA family oxidoreductase [Saprospiraceae bacterium]|nr:Gfo/Idh/MocA family oxidoreductase [Saprospiraceae bacterium]MBP7679458.1 Gfo/Idh/MocA family oxidoreductase [Saprospiraceae bacterium]